MFRSIKEAEAIHGGLSKPSKMPGFAYGLPAKNCKTGGKLRAVKGSVCSKCYAMKGRYVFGNVAAAQERRLASLTHPDWVAAMVWTIRAKGCEYFRWHDSGDLQGMKHFANIIEVARQCPDTKFWLPTKEVGFVSQMKILQKDWPKNLIVRVSAAMIGETAPKKFAHTSMVVEDAAQATCRSFENGGVCGECRKCWDKRVKVVAYLAH